MTTMIPLSQITRNPGQPRETFPKEHIERLAASISARGLIQAVTLRREAPDRYTIVAGECRFRAHQLLGASEIRAEIVDVDDLEMSLRAIVENVQRQDMNPMEEARAFKTLLDNGMTVQAIVDQLGFKGRDRVQNRLNLLDLAPSIQSLVSSGNLSTSMASAIALAPRHHQTRLVHEIDAGTLRTVDQIRHAAQALRDAVSQLDAFASSPVASEVELESVRTLERRIEAVAQMVLSGFDEGRCVVAQRVAPGRVKTMADKLSLVRKHVLQMEHQLRCVIAQIEITNPRNQRSEDHQHPAAVGVASRGGPKGRGKQNVADNVSRHRSDPRISATGSRRQRQRSERLHQDV